MLYVMGVGEIAISLSGDPGNPGELVHTIRSVGAVSRALAHLRAGAEMGLRGPYGSAWPVESARGRDVVVAAGGLGMAPLRPVIYQLVRERHAFGRIYLLYGTRTPSDFLFKTEWKRWRSQGIEIRCAVGTASPKWKGDVGHVTTLVPKIELKASDAVALVCGPEVMMRYTAYELEKKGLPPENIHLSLERNMKCAIGFCGHCQFGPHFICKDGPVLPFARGDRLLRIREV
jgi:NAD(P)H-flavin reductase